MVGDKSSTRPPQPEHGGTTAGEGLTPVCGSCFVESFTAAISPRGSGSYLKN